MENEFIVSLTSDEVQWLAFRLREEERKATWGWEDTSFYTNFLGKLNERTNEEQVGERID